MECIVLAGGLGTRLRGVIGEQPKCMAPVIGQPFLAFLFRYLEQQGCTKSILSLGYKHEVVLDWLSTQTPAFEVMWVIEEEPLGTGGGIRLAMEKSTADKVFVLNGDTFFDVNLAQMQVIDAATVITLKHLHNFDRYGSVTVDENDVILSFEEKKPMPEGFINGGIYCIDRKQFLNVHFPEKFSFEKDYLETFVAHGLFKAYRSEGYFIDIGVPADYEKAQHDFKDFLPA